MAKINKNLMFVLLIALLSVIVYGNTFFNEFVWDDYVFILDKPEIKSFSNIPQFFLTDTDGTYRPLRSVHYTAIYSIFKENTFGYHLNALCFHIVISILVYLIILNLINKRNIAFLASLLFALHPIHTGRVTNMTAGFDLLGIFLFLLSFYFYILFSKCRKSETKQNLRFCVDLKMQSIFKLSEHAQKSERFLTEKKINYFIGSVMVFLIGLFASEEIVTLPFIIILYELCFNRKNIFQNFKEKLIKFYSPFFIILASYLILRFFVLGIIGRSPEYASQGLFFTLFSMAKVFVGYIMLLIAPINLKLFYEMPVSNTLFELDIIISLFVLALILFFTVKFYNKIVFFSVMWFFITLIPFSNLIPLVFLMAERYLYLPSIGFCLLLAFVLNKLYNLNKKYLKTGVVVFIVLLLSFYSFAAINRNAEWRDNLILWTETVKDCPASSRAHDNLGFTYEHMGNYEGAIIEFSKAVELKPDNFRALSNLGVALAKIKEYNKSIFYLEKSLKVNPYSYKTYNKLGLVYSEIGDYEPAIAMQKKAISLNPYFAKGYNDLGIVYGYIGDFNASLTSFKKAIGIDYDYADAHFNLGVLYNFLGQKDKALEELRIATGLDPQNERYEKIIRDL